MLKHFSRKKRQWIYKEFYDRLYQLFDQYPTEHATIRKAFIISYSTYFRLRKEGKGGDLNKKVRKRFKRKMKIQSKIEKNLVWLIVRLPKYLLTLNEI